MTDNVIKFERIAKKDDEEVQEEFEFDDEEYGPFEVGFDAGFDEARETFGAMLEDASEDAESPDSFKTGFFIGFAVFFEEWLTEYQKMIAEKEGSVH